MNKHILASLGYLELGMTKEAWEELEIIPQLYRHHPHVLRQKVEICRCIAKWNEMSEIANLLVNIEPDKPDHWISLAWGQRRSVGLDEAEKTLLAALKLFPKEATIYFNLACYACKQDRLEEARRLLKRAIELEPTFKKTAFLDEDLEAIRESSGISPIG
jgi:tetratricopeptide (TPR) repeat protein